MADGEVLEQTKRKLTNLLKQPGWEVIRWDAFVPQWQAQCDAAGVAMREDLSEAESGDTPVLVMPHDVHLTTALRNGIKEAGIGLLWAQANLVAEVSFTGDWVQLPCCISGELHADALRVDIFASLQVLGAVRCRHLLDYSAQDDEVTWRPSLRQVHTPLAFFWFVRCDAPLVLPPDAVIFILATWDECEELVHTMPNPMLIWHECMHALRDELYGVPEDEGDDGPEWRFDRIEQRLNAGESIWRDGFDPAALAPWRQGKALQAAKEPELAWMAFRQAVALAPGFSPALASMGRILFDEGAVQQALPYLQRAHAAFPKQQTAFEDESAYYLSLSLLYAGQADEARDVAQAEQARLSDDLVGAQAQLQRVLLEINLAQGRLAEAEQNLQALQGTAWANYGSVHWLRGLRHWHMAQQAGEDEAVHLAQAESERVIALGKNALFDLAYAAHTNLRAVKRPEHRLDWPEREVKLLDEAQTVALQAKLVDSEPKNIGQVPQAQRTAGLLHALVAQCVDSASTWLPAFDPALVQAEVNADVAAQLVRANADVLGHVPPALVTHALCMQAQQNFDGQVVPESVWDEALALHALASGAHASQIPRAVITPAVALAMVREHGFAIRHVPQALQTDALWVQAVAWYDGTYFFREQLPWRLSQSPEFLRAVVDVRIEALDAIPAPRVDAELFAHAKARHGQHPDWADRVRCHQFQWLRAEDEDLGENWWRVFWTEADVLATMGPSDGLRPYEIPADFFTQAIADACYRCHGTTWIECVPAQFVPDERYAAWLRAGDEIDLSVLPMARRSAALCALAIEHGHAPQAVPAPMLLPTAELLLANAGWALDGKLAKKEGKLLARACTSVTQDTDGDAYIKGLDEAMQHADWVLLRAQAWLTPTAPQLQEAQADAQWVLQATAALGDAPPPDLQGDHAPRLWALRRRAWFWLGLVLWQGGQHEQAQQLRAASGMHTLPDYADFKPASLQASADFDREAFGHLMAEIEDTEDAALAWQAALQAQHLLQASSSREPKLWAHVLDKKRWASLELGDFDGNRQACEDMVQRLSGLQLMPFDANDQAVGSMLAAAHHRLGARILDDAEDPDAPQPDVASLRQALVQHERARALCASDEDAGENLAGYWDSRLRILQRLAQSGASDAALWQARLARELDRVRGLDGHGDWHWSDEGEALLNEPA